MAHILTNVNTTPPSPRCPKNMCISSGPQAIICPFHDNYQIPSSLNYVLGGPYAEAYLDRNKENLSVFSLPNQNALKIIIYLPHSQLNHALEPST